MWVCQVGVADVLEAPLKKLEPMGLASEATLYVRLQHRFHTLIQNSSRLLVPT